MATLKQRRELINNADLQAKVRVAAYDHAVYNLNDEAKADRHPYFQNIVSNPDNWDIKTLLWEVVLNPDIQNKMISNPAEFSEKALDTDIVYVVNTTLDKLSTPETAV
jgi:hypothetical protein